MVSGGEGVVVAPVPDSIPSASDNGPMNSAMSGCQPDQRDQLLQEHWSLARQLARRFANRGEPIDDLNQVAMMALLKAVERFDPSREVKFATYASRVISGELKRHFRDRTWAMRVPRSLQELNLRAKAGTEVLRGSLQRPPTVPELARYLGVSEEDVLEAMEAGRAYRLTSIDASFDDGHGPTTIKVGGDDPGMADVEHRPLRETLMSRLSADDQVIVRLYYSHGMSQADIGEMLGLSQVQVSRRLARVLTRLRGLADIAV